MNKKIYIQPAVRKTRTDVESSVMIGSWGADGEHEPIIDDDPDEIFSKEREDEVWGDLW